MYKAMQLEDYFEFLRPDEIRLKGTRVGIESILDEYVNNGKLPEEIALMFSSVTLEQVYATILYYLHDKEKIGKYLEDWIAYTIKAQKEFDKNPPSFVKRLLKLREKQKVI